MDMAERVMITFEHGDGCNFVKKAVSWALRQIGKLNDRLRAAAIETAREILARSDGKGKWVASDALRELES
jgi:3-methyladenine DNA glycosylase AlkD